MGELDQKVQDAVSKALEGSVDERVAQSVNKAIEKLAPGKQKDTSEERKTPPSSAPGSSGGK